MKQFRSLLPMLTLAAASFMVSCEESSSDNSSYNQFASDHFDVWVSLDDTGDAMNIGSTMLVNSVESLDDADVVVNFVNEGADVTSTLHDETLIKDGYYYQIPQAEGRFGKYKIENGVCTTVKELQLPDGAVLPARKYCGEWIDDDTLVIMGAINSAQDVAWIKINTTEMTVISSGTLALNMSDIAWQDAEKSYTLSTSGLVSYRAQDDRLIYAYSVKRRADASATKNSSMDVSVAFINPTDMSIETTVTDARVEQTYGTSFGELLQNTTFFTENGDYYICCRSSNNITTDNYQSGFIRIKSGESKIDTEYLGLYELDEKVCSADYIGNNEVLVYSQNPMLTLGTADSWSSSLYSCYYSIWNIADNTRKELECDGKKLPYTADCLITQIYTYANDKIYIGVMGEDRTGVYLYDTKTKEVTLGATITAGYELLRIVAQEQ